MNHDLTIETCDRDIIAPPLDPMDDWTNRRAALKAFAEAAATMRGLNPPGELPRRIEWRAQPEGKDAEQITADVERRVLEVNNAHIDDPEISLAALERPVLDLLDAVREWAEIQADLRAADEEEAEEGGDG